MAEKIRVSEAEKLSFVNRYFTNTEERKYRPEKSTNQDSDWPRECSVIGRATPKRFREEETKFSTGELINKKTKIDSTFCEEGVQGATTLNFCSGQILLSTDRQT